MNKFGAAAGCAFGKIGLLQQQGRISPACGIHGNTQTGGAASNDNDIPTNGLLQLFQKKIAVKGYCRHRLNEVDLLYLLIKNREITANLE